MHERYRRTSRAGAAWQLSAARVAESPLSSASPTAGGALGEGCRATIPARVFQVQPEPERIPEVFRPVEPRSSGSEVVVIEQGRRPADAGETVLCEARQDGESLGGG